jgi:5-methyltetrahydropteroyltriglutamate--homocysteine methyltransferase
MFREVQSYQPMLAALNGVDADALTFETCSSGPGDLQAIGQVIKDKKIVIGVIDHHTLQVERPDEVAALIREALKHIAPERLIISSDCGMGREGMSRRHAVYKMVAMVLGTNIVRKELGLPEAPCLAADPRYSLTLTAKHDPRDTGSKAVTSPHSVAGPCAVAAEPHVEMSPCNAAPREFSPLTPAACRGRGS